MLNFSTLGDIYSLARNLRIFLPERGTNLREGNIGVPLTRQEAFNLSRIPSYLFFSAIKES